MSDITLASDAAGKRLFLLGNEAIARGAIEAGVQVVAGYPGTPSTEITETLINLADRCSIHTEWSVNEKVAFGVAMGAARCGVRALAVMKHVGMNVALDSIFTASYMGTPGGLVLIEAEDPGQWSSQDEQDNRYLAAQTYLPMLEPSSVQEAKDMARDAFVLSEQYGQPFILRSTTRLGHARSDVVLGKIFRPQRTAHFTKDPGSLVYLPATARAGRRLMVERMSRIKDAVDSLPYNHLNLVNGAALGIITSGIPYRYVLEALNLSGLQERVSILKIGTVYPLPEKLIRDLLQAVPEVLVVEETEPFLEDQVRVIAQKTGLPTIIHGKDRVPLTGELSPRRVIEAIAATTHTVPPIDFSVIDIHVKDAAPLLPSRPPSLCPGCPHRASHYAIKVACDQYQRETGIEPVKPGDIGCNALGSLAPLNDIDIATCMGGGFDLSNGFSKVLDVPVVAHLGDSTFFHSGLPPMVNAVHNGARITMIVLDNLTTAMTGSQPSPSSGYDGRSANKPILPEALARASGIKFVRVVDPFDLPTAIRTVEKAIKFNGPSFIVFRRPCAILEQREKQIRGEKTIPHTVNQEKCIADTLPSCTAACPLHIDVRGYVKLAREGKYDASLNLIQEKLPFPGILGRICTHPCETKCKRGEVDEAISIAALKRTAAEFGESDNEYLKIKQERSEKVAIVGAGPAGLMAAYDLRKAGYQVTVFEAQPVMGGMLTAGIPAYRLAREIAGKEIDCVRRMGVEVKLSTRIGVDIKLQDLKEKYNAVLLATGAHRSRDLGIPGSKSGGVINGIEFLKDVNLGKKVQARNRVAVIGGGNVAVDCARTCLRSGYKEVNIVYRRDRKNMPAIAEEVKEAEKEGVKLIFLSNPVRVLSSAGKVTGIECMRMRLGKPDAGGRERPDPISGSEFKIEVDEVISAIGEQPDLDFLKGDKTEPAIKNGLVAADPVTLATSIPGLFAAGDMVSGPATVIGALAAGRKAAISIDRYLKGEPMDTSRTGEGTQVSPLSVETYGVKQESRQKMPTIPVKQRQGNMQEVETGLSCDTAQKEASRCLECGCGNCIKKLGCPAISIVNDEVTIDQSQCPGCGLCSRVCPAEAIGPVK